MFCVLPSVAIKRMASSYLHINVQMATIVGILTIISRPMINTKSKCYEKKKSFPKINDLFSCYEQLKFHAQ